MSAWGMHLGQSARRQILAVCWLVALSGALWIVLGWLSDPEDYLDPLRAWRHRTLVLHGIAAYAVLWVTGRLFTLHQQGNWRAQRNRASGLILSFVLLSLAGSGLTLYYPPHEEVRDILSFAHQILGVLLALSLPLHVVAAKRLRRLRKHPDNAR